MYEENQTTTLDQTLENHINKRIVETLYFDFLDETENLPKAVIPKMNEVLKEFYGNETPTTHWYRGLTVEKVNGKIHRLIFDFD